MFKLTLAVILAFLVIRGYAQEWNKNYPKVTFADVGQSPADTLQFVATVKSIYKCPPCPPGAHCKPCIGDHVLVSNGNSEFDFRVFTHQLSIFEENGVYHFLVRFRSKLHRIDNIELITSK